VIFVASFLRLEVERFCPVRDLDNSPAIYRWVSGRRAPVVRAIDFATLRNATEDEILPRPCFDLVYNPVDG